MKLTEKLREVRTQLGLTQSALGNLSGTSLPTVQNLELGRGNPTLNVLNSLASALGLEVSLSPRAPDWDYLIQCGLPLDNKLNLVSVQDFNLNRVRGELFLATLGGQSSEREREAITAFLLAIKTHYPSVYRKCFYKTQALNELLPKIISGRLIKLSRIARGRVSKYL